ncbi:hypothetical protein Tco_0648058 [Tanacetum coccineum]
MGKEDGLRNILDADFFLWKDDRLRDLMSSSGAPFAGPSTPSSDLQKPQSAPNCKQLRKIVYSKETMESAYASGTTTHSISAALLHEVP